jgi:CubicO group peptidase (beta-lactamase class C family)
VRNGQVAYAKGYGVLNLRDRTPVQPSSIFALGSITKQFTAAAIMQLEQRQKLSVDDSLCKYCPRFGLCGELTLRNLLNHTSGITNQIPENMPPRADHILPVAQEMKRIEEAGLDFAPNSRYRYSNMDYAILGFVVEKVSGLSDRDYITSSILDPLGMTSTSWYTKWQGQMLNHAAGYRCLNRQCREVVSHPRSHGFESAGGMVSNVFDLAKWDVGFMAGKVVDQIRIQQAFTRPLLTNGRTSNYGFAWVAQRVNGHPCYFHNGAIQGFTAWNMIFPHDLSAIIVMTNRSTIPWFRRPTPAG